ncbi:MAG: hypothetical protein EXS13_06445 [Planctomycetes bacterium]|nr:hypothetical protein [Planctomycetota bacterium]
MPSQFSFGFPELLLSSRLVESGASESWCLELALAADADASPFLIAAGLEQALALLEDLSLATTDLMVLRAEPGPARVDATLDAAALAKVGELRFHGDVEAVPEGTVVFAGEPLLRLRARAAEAATVFQALTGVVRTQSALATAMARFRLAAAGKPCFEAVGALASREEALLAARAAQIGGAAGTTQPLAAGAHSLPTLPIVPFSGLVALGGRLRGLSSCAVEIDGAARNRTCAALAAIGEAPRAIVVEGGRGGLALSEFARVRTRLDELGFQSTKLFAGGDLDRGRVAELAAMAVDGFVIGTPLLAERLRLQDALVLELVERCGEGGGPIERRDGGHGPRAVWRRRASGRFHADTVQPDTQAPPPGCAPLLVPMMRGGKRLFRAPSLTEVRVLCESQLSMFEPALLTGDGESRYPIEFVGTPPRAVVAEPAAVVIEPLLRDVPEAQVESAVPDVPPRLFDQVDDSADFTLVSNAFATVVTQQFGLPAQEATMTLPSAPDAEPAVEPAAEPCNPLLAAAKRLRAMQRGESVAPTASSMAAIERRVAESAPAFATAEPVTTSSDPLLAAAARLKRLRGG